VRSGVRVESVTRKNGRYLVRTSRGAYDVAHAVVAMANYQKSRAPAFAKDLRADIVQIHTGHAPFRLEGFWGRFILARLLLRVLFHRIMTVRTPMGRKMRAKVLGRGGPLIRVKPKDLASVGVERVPRVAGVREGLPVLDDGRILDVANVVWCTGFERGFDFIQLPIFDESGEPRHVEGVALGEPGRYFVGLHFLYAMSSTMIHGVGRDAARIATIVSHNVAHARSKVV
jgi:putative flavoprotein involved in K+ transport